MIIRCLVILNLLFRILQFKHRRMHLLYQCLWSLAAITVFLECDLFWCWPCPCFSHITTSREDRQGVFYGQIEKSSSWRKDCPSFIPTAGHCFPLGEHDIASTGDTRGHKSERSIDITEQPPDASSGQVIGSEQDMCLKTDQWVFPWDTSAAIINFGIRFLDYYVVRTEKWSCLKQLLPAGFSKSDWGSGKKTTMLFAAKARDESPISSVTWTHKYSFWHIFWCFFFLISGLKWVSAQI